MAIRWGSAPDDDMDDVFDVQKMTDKFKEEKLNFEDEEEMTWEEKMMQK